MSDKVNVLIFPAGGENGIDIFESLRYNLHFNIFGASAKSDHAEFIYEKDKLYIGELFIDSGSFFEKFDSVLKRFAIDYILPTHDKIALFLTKHQERIAAKVVCSPYETALIANNKLMTYHELSGYDFCPEVYEDTLDIKTFPVFMKPIEGVGGKGASIVRSKTKAEELLKQKDNFILCEYLPGKEYTVDCFTDKYGSLLFIGPRIRERIIMGITMHSERVCKNSEISSIANVLNREFKLRGAWFFQLKENKNGLLKLMEFSVRQSGTMGFYRQLGINFAALSLFDAMGHEVKILFNDYPLTLDKRLKSSYRIGFVYDKIYLDFDDTLVVNGKVNTTLLKYLYQSVNNKKQIILLTKHEKNLDESLKKYRINKSLFDKVIRVDPEKNKADYIDNTGAIFIDNHFPERLSVKEKCNIPVFDVDAVECLIDYSAL